MSSMNILPKDVRDLSVEKR